MKYYVFIFFVVGNSWILALVYFVLCSYCLLKLLSLYSYLWLIWKCLLPMCPYIFAGSLSDPGNISGLAHFCEHMLFLGTQKYPKENEYSQFLSEHAGSSNAFTSGEHTNYYFDVSHEHLQGALDRYSHVLLIQICSRLLFISSVHLIYIIGCLFLCLTLIYDSFELIQRTWHLPPE